MRRGIVVLREFVFVERKKGKWFYILENIDAPITAWNWLDYAEASGPFYSLEDAMNCCNKEPLENTIITNDHYIMLSEDTRRLYDSLIESIRR